MLKRMMIYGLFNAGTGPVMPNTVNINFDDQDRGVVEPMWNNWLLGNSNNLDLLNSEGNPTGIKLSVADTGGTYAEYEGNNQKDPDGVFPSRVLEQMLNRGSANIITQFTGLSASKTYKLTFAAVQSYPDPGDATSVTANGISVDLGGPSEANVVYKKSLIVVNPAGGVIDMAFSPNAGNLGYACMNAMIIEEQ